MKQAQPHSLNSSDTVAGEVDGLAVEAAHVAGKEPPCLIVHCFPSAETLFETAVAVEQLMAENQYSEPADSAVDA